MMIPSLNEMVEPTIGDFLGCIVLGNVIYPQRRRLNINRERIRANQEPQEPPQPLRQFEPVLSDAFRINRDRGDTHLFEQLDPGNSLHSLNLSDSSQECTFISNQNTSNGSRSHQAEKKIDEDLRNEECLALDYLKTMNPLIPSHSKSTAPAPPLNSDTETTPLIQKNNFDHHTIKKIPSLRKEAIETSTKPDFLSTLTTEMQHLMGLGDSDNEGTKLIAGKLQNSSITEDTTPVTSLLNRSQTTYQPRAKSSSGYITGHGTLMNALLTKERKTRSQDTRSGYTPIPDLASERIRIPSLNASDANTLQELESLEEREPLLADLPKTKYGSIDLPSQKLRSSRIYTSQEASVHNQIHQEQNDQFSVSEIKQYHQQTTNPHIVELYQRIVDNSKAFATAIRNKRYDEKICYQNAMNHFYKAADCYVMMQDTKTSQQAILHEGIANEYEHAANHFAQVAQLTQSDSQTGPLLLTTREDQQKTEHRLAEFSFGQKDSIQKYSALISSPNIISGSNIETIQQQKGLIRDALSHLQTAKEFEAELN